MTSPKLPNHVFWLGSTAEIALGGGWKRAKELGVSKIAFKEGPKQLPGVLEGHGWLTDNFGKRHARLRASFNFHTLSESQSLHFWLPEFKYRGYSSLEPGLDMEWMRNQTLGNENERPKPPIRSRWCRYHLLPACIKLIERYVPVVCMLSSCLFLLVLLFFLGATRPVFCYHAKGWTVFITI